MASELEQLTVVGVALNSDAGPLYLDDLKFTPAEPRPQWVGGADADGEILADETHYGNATFEGTLQLQKEASMDDALARVGALHAALLELERGGGDVVWTPAGSDRPMTFEGLQGQMGDLPISIESGWLSNEPTVGFRLVCAPFWRDLPIDTVTESFGANVIGDYTVDAGSAANVSITGGVMQAIGNLTTENRFVRSSGVPYPELYDAQSTLKPKPGTTLSGFKAGPILKRTAASTYLEVYVDDNGTNSRLRIDKVVGGVRTNVQSTNLAARIATNTAFWVRGRIEGDTVYAEYWATAPTNTGTATLAPAGVALTGADATTFGQGVEGRYGLVFLPQQVAATLDDWVLEPNVWVSSAPALTGVLPGVPGTAPAEGRLRITDRAGQARRFAEWGIEQPDDLTTSLLIDSDSLTTAGLAGAQTTRTGAYDPNASGNNVIRANLFSQPIVVCGLGSLTHVGTYRVKARVYASSLDVRIRVAWQEGDSPFRSNGYVAPPADSAFAEVDLGLVTIDEKVAGAQRWSGRIEAYSTTAGDTLDIDHLVLVPAGVGYGKARAGTPSETGVVQGHDQFTGIGSGTALNARGAPLGGTWATSGATGDFTGATIGGADLLNAVWRSGSGDSTPRRAVLGSATFTDMEVGVRTYFSSYGDTRVAEPMVMARYVDSTNHVRARYDHGAQKFSLERLLTSGTKVLGSVTLALSREAYYYLRLKVYASGRVSASILSSGGNELARVDAVATELATGGTLASGKPGFADRNTNPTLAAPRYYDDFYVAVPAAEPIVVYPGRAAEVRHDSVIREDSTGTYYGDVPTYRGARLFVPPAGAGGRVGRLLVRAARNDLDAADSPDIADRLQAQVIVTPRSIGPT